MGVAHSLCSGDVYSNRKLSIVMALSTTFTQCAPEITKFSKITQHKGHFAVQGHSRYRFCYRSKAHIQLPISRRQLGKYCASPGLQKLQNRYIWLPLLPLTPSPTERFPWDNLRKISVDVNGWPRYQMAKKYCRKFQPAE